MNYNIPRLLISSPKSGGGKTIFTASLAKALKDRNIDICTFKCGPDYVDPMLHKESAGKRAKNLDLFFNSEDLLKERFYLSSKESSFALIEGAMGFYDGMGGTTDINSACHVSECLKTPVVLIVDCEGSSFSLCALINGFLSFKENDIKAVILNKCSSSLFSIIKPVIERECKVLVLGFIPKDERLSVRNIKLGLDLENKEETISLIEYMAELIKNNIDLDKLINIAEDADAINILEKEAIKDNLNLKAAVSKDKAFSFIYDDNIRFLEKMGCKIEYFSPLYESQLPKDIDLCLITGGFAEKYCKELSENINMLSSIKDFYNNGGTVIAEGAGFSYLCKDIKDYDGKRYKLCGVIDASVEKTDKLTNFGYIELFDENDNAALRGHEFHYSKSTNDGDSFTARRYKSSRSRKTIYHTERLFCGYPQFDYYANSEFFINFLRNIKKK